MEQNYLAIDIGGTKIASAIVTLTKVPKVSHKRQIPTLASNGGEDVLKRLCGLVAEQLELTQTQGIALAGIGIGSAGVVDSTKGMIASATDLMPGWAGQLVVQALKQVSDLPIYMVGDVGAHGLGEAVYGAGKNYKSQLCVGVGTGIGGAFIQDGQIVAGAHNVAGHIGHMAHGLGKGFSCSCGTTSGHIEPVASGTGLADLYRSLVLQNINQQKQSDLNLDEIQGKQVVELALAGDEIAQTTLQNSGRALGEVVAGACNLLDPEVVIFSGSVIKAGDLWWSSVCAGFKDAALTLLKDIPLLLAELGDDAPLIGAACAVEKYTMTN